MLVAALLAAIGGLLALHAVITGALASEAEAPIGHAAHVPDTVRTGGPVVDARRTPTTLGPPARTLALTFDDGPDPRWTPAILAVLARHRVHATFFVTGAHAAQHPGLVRDILAAGHEVGHHTATHVDLRTAGPLRTWLELRSTDLVLAHSAGVSTALVRPPYSATPRSLDDAAWAVTQRLGASGRLVVLSSVDSGDWQRPGVNAIVANATPPNDTGAVLLMHDGGGDRSQTVAALDRLIPTLRRQGWRIDTVTEAIGARDTASAASTLDRLGGALLVGAVQLSDAVPPTVGILVLAATALAVLRTLLVLTTALIHVRRTRRPPSPASAAVTVIVPAYNEAAGIEATVRSIVASRHPVEVVVVDDGSTDATADIVQSLGLPGVRLIRQANGGKAAALNTALRAARAEVVVMVDGDTVLEPDTVGWLAAHFTDPRVGAVSGNAKVGNRRSLLGCWQHIEYVIGFNLDRRMYDVLGCMPTVPGAVGAFRRSAILAAGGVGQDTLAEDTDLTVALQRAGWQVTYEQRATAWTEAPATLGQLCKQRYRWCYGTLQAIWKHRHAVLEPGPAGRIGRRGMPYLLLFQVALPVIAPIVDLAALVSLLTHDSRLPAISWLGFLLLQAISGIVAFRLDRERSTALLALPLQQLIYRPLMWLIVVQSLATALSGVHLPWHKLDRRGTATISD